MHVKRFYFSIQIYFLKADGMRELNRLNIAHRDIKPNNILLTILPHGEHVYKLTDFGAAKEIENNEPFASIVGTEEYLYPGLYEKAFYRNASGNKFNADVDLWSIGVTLYHTATGQLPFRVYGGRANHDGM
jgi:TANK-binding kinase 1